MPRTSATSIFLIFLRLGLTSFGGPVAHLGYFRDAFVVRRRWLDEAGYSNIVALCQTLPGPASSQVGMMIGLTRGGIPGIVAAWLGFTLPSAIMMIACGYGIDAFGKSGDIRWLHGLELVAVAVVAQAVTGMAKLLCQDRTTSLIALSSAAMVLILPGPAGQNIVMITAALVGYQHYRGRVPTIAPAPGIVQFGRTTGIIALGLFGALLFGLPLLQAATSSPMAGLLALFFRAGALVFGGGHVVLPLLATGAMAHGALSRDEFLAGYALAQAVPGPLFTIAAYLGTLMTGGASRWVGGVVAVIAIFAPSFLMIIGVTPFWQRWGQRPGVRAALTGVNASVVGLLLAALYKPLAASAIQDGADVAVAALAFLMLTRFAVPAWLLVLLSLLYGRLGALGPAVS